MTAKNKDLLQNKDIGFMQNINQTYLRHINESKFVIGIAMILLNVGSKYVDFKFTKQFHFV